MINPQTGRDGLSLDDALAIDHSSVQDPALLRHKIDALEILLLVAPQSEMLRQRDLVLHNLMGQFEGVKEENLMLRAKIAELELRAAPTQTVLEFPVRELLPSLFNTTRGREKVFITGKNGRVISITSDNPTSDTAV